MHLKHWKNCLSIIKKKINAQSYVTWFKPIVPKSYSNKTLSTRRKIDLELLRLEFYLNNFLVQ